MMDRIRDLGAQARRMQATFAAVLIPMGIVLLAVAIVGTSSDLTIDDLVRDPLGVVGVSPFVGFASNLGVVLWAAAAGACFTAALALRRRGDADASRFFTWSGALTSLLAFDDLYRLHEEVAPVLLGRIERFIILGYVVLVAVYVWAYRRRLAAAEIVLLVASGACFALSIAVDFVPDRFYPDAFVPYARLVEDGAKLVGIAFWLAFFLRTAAAALAAPPAADAAPPPG